MRFGNFLKEKWDSFCRSLNPDPRRELLEILSQEYAEKAENAVKFTEYAARMVYPQFRDNLLRIANEEQEHISRLREHIVLLGGEVPQLSYSPTIGKNDWHRLLTLLEKKKRSVPDRIDRLLQAEGIDPGIARELRRMRQQEGNRRAEIRNMLMRSDPQAG
jgi:hypothetical protein